MSIKVALRFSPFSHRPKTQCLLPGSLLSVEIYPTRCVIYDYQGIELKQLTCLDFVRLGPLTQFTVQQDLEKGIVFVSGFTKTGYFRYQITAAKEHPFFEISFIKVPDAVCMQVDEAKECTIQVKERYVFPEEKKAITLVALPKRERLALGCHKAQEWEKVVARNTMCEILPFWYYLSQSVPVVEEQKDTDASLLGELRAVIEQKDTFGLDGALSSCFLSGFSDIFLPQKKDAFYQGFSYPPISSNVATPIMLLQQSFFLLRSLFFQEIEDVFTILPFLSPTMHCGQLVSIQTKEGHTLSFEWVKKQIRKVIFEPITDCSYLFLFKKQIKQYRLTVKGQKTSCLNGQNLVFCKNTHYVLDQFEK